MLEEVGAPPFTFDLELSCPCCLVKNENMKAYFRSRQSRYKKNV